MEIVERRVDEIIPYDNNPRNNDKAVERVAESLKQFGWKQPIVVDTGGVIVAGHTRLKAAKLLGMEVAPVLVADDLDEEQIKAYRLADNKVAEFAEWDFSKLEDELNKLDNIDMSLFGFEKLQSSEEDEKYTLKSNIPQYDPTGVNVTLDECLDTQKRDALCIEIEEANITEKEKKFLREAANRHVIFDYRNIAEYYATASEEMQKLMERSALVIIDVDNAIANGYAELSGRISELREKDA